MLRIAIGSNRSVLISLRVSPNKLHSSLLSTISQLIAQVGKKDNGFLALLKISIRDTDMQEGPMFLVRMLMQLFRQFLVMSLLMICV